MEGARPACCTCPGLAEICQGLALTPQGPALQAHTAPSQSSLRLSQPCNAARPCHASQADAAAEARELAGFRLCSAVRLLAVFERSLPARPTGVRAARAAGRALPVARHTVTPAFRAACKADPVSCFALSCNASCSGAVGDVHTCLGVSLLTHAGLLRPRGPHASSLEGTRRVLDGGSGVIARQGKAAQADLFLRTACGKQHVARWRC